MITKKLRFAARCVSSGVKDALAVCVFCVAIEDDLRQKSTIVRIGHRPIVWAAKQIVRKGGLGDAVCLRREWKP